MCGSELCVHSRNNTEADLKSFQLNLTLLLLIELQELLQFIVVTEAGRTMK